jgi:hypothetical protein
MNNRAKQLFVPSIKYQSVLSSLLYSFVSLQISGAMTLFVSFSSGPIFVHSHF